MKISRLASAASLLIAFALPFLAGCANPAPPRPPSLQLPAPVDDLQAERIADQVLLHWSTPSETTDKLPLKQPLTALLCRIPGPCITLPVSSGASQTVDALPPSLATDPPVKLTYRVTIQNSAKRSANPSNAATSVSGSAPPPIPSLEAAPARTGTRVTWPATGSGPGYSIELHRQQTLSITSNNHGNKDLRLNTTNSARARQSPEKTIDLRLAVAQASTDSGGALDETTTPGETYTYTATRLRTVTLDKVTYIIRGATSPPVTLLARDITPPAAPKRLAVVVDGSAADLSWEPNTEPDLVGYIIYRSQQVPEPSTPNTPPPAWQRLNTEPLPAPAFHDPTLPSSGIAQYRITAVDSSGNESLPSQTAVIPVHSTFNP